MDLIWKDCLWPGRYTWPSGRELRIADADIRNAHNEGKRMLAAGLSVPFCWEHQPDAAPVELSSVVYSSPEAKAAWTKNTIEYVKDFKVENVPGRGSVLFAAIDKSKLNPSEIKTLEKVGKVSPRVDINFRDARGDGTAYRGYTVGHIAVTPRPLEPDQGPFQMAATSEETFYLGAAVAKEPETPDEPMAEETVETPAASPDMGIQSVIDALREKGFNIPDEVVDAAGLVIAIKACEAKPESAALGDVPNVTQTTAAGGAPLMMSQAEMQATRPQIVAADRRDIERRFDLLVSSGRVSPPVAAARKREFSRFELSYSNGEIDANGVVAELLAYEKLPAGMVMSPNAKAAFELTAVPAPSLSPESDRGMEEVLEETRRLAARNSAKATK